MAKAIANRVSEIAQKVIDASCDQYLSEYSRQELTDEFADELALARLVQRGWVTEISPNAEARLARTYVVIRRHTALERDPYGSNIGLGEAGLAILDDLRNAEHAWYGLIGLYPRDDNGTALYADGRRAWARALMGIADDAETWASDYIEIERRSHR